MFRLCWWFWGCCLGCEGGGVVAYFVGIRLDLGFEDAVLVAKVVLLLHILVVSVWILVLRMLFWLSVLMVVVLWHILVVSVWVLVLSMLFWL